MTKIDNHTFYSYAYEKYGVSAKGVHWHSKERQYQRFEILMDYLKDELEESSLLDVGCGYGDLINYFQENNLYPKSYTGIDCEEIMCQNASKRFPLSNFLRKDFLYDELPKADYYVCSGSLNILTKEEFLYGIRQCFKQCEKGFVFNFVTDSFIHGLSVFDIYIYCHTLTKDIKFQSGYIKNDHTFFLKK